MQYVEALSAYDAADFVKCNDIVDGGLTALDTKDTTYKGLLLQTKVLTLKSLLQVKLGFFCV